MAARLLEGKPVAEAVLERVTEQAAALSKQGIVAGLGTILVGENDASASYVRKKHETCQRVGIDPVRQRPQLQIGCQFMEFEFFLLWRSANEIQPVVLFIVDLPAYGPLFDGDIFRQRTAAPGDRRCNRFGNATLIERTQQFGDAWNWIRL